MTCYGRGGPQTDPTASPSQRKEVSGGYCAFALQKLPWRKVMGCQLPATPYHIAFTSVTKVFSDAFASPKSIVVLSR